MWIPLPHLACLRVAGADAKTFLQGQLSCDLDKIDAQHASLAVYCNLQGRVVCSLRVFAIEEDIICILPGELLDETVTLLKKYALFSKVTIAQDDNLSVYGDLAPSTPLAFNEVKHADDTTFVGVGLAAPRHLCVTTRADSEPSQEGQVDEWLLADIQDGIATITEETSARFVPHRLNYQAIGALDFDKGCYLGQEIIARMHYRGQLKHHCYHVHNPQGIDFAGDIIQSSQAHSLVVLSDQQKSQLPESIQIINLPYAF